MPPKYNTLYYRNVKCICIIRVYIFNIILNINAVIQQYIILKFINYISYYILYYIKTHKLYF
jgi:hypothetical protein